MIITFLETIIGIYIIVCYLLLFFEIISSKFENNKDRFLSLLLLIIAPIAITLFILFCLWALYKPIKNEKPNIN